MVQVCRLQWLQANEDGLATQIQIKWSASFVDLDDGLTQKKHAGKICFL